MSVTLPNSKVIASEKTIVLPEPKELPPRARSANVFSQLTEGALTSIGQYCDEGCTAVFDEHHVKLYRNKNLTIAGDIILTGDRNAHNKLWYFDLSRKNGKITQLPSQSATANAANYIIPKTNSEKLTRFLHGAIGSPAPQALMKSLSNNQLTTWPHLTPSNVRQSIRAPTATILGHMDHQRKNKLPSRTLQIELEKNLDACPQPSKLKCNKTYITVYESSDRIHSDQTGKFPIKSIRGNQYVMIIYVYDTNTILYRPLKTKKAEELQVVYDEAHNYLVTRGCKPTFHRIDNELSQETKALLEKTFGATIEIVPPYCHRRNAAERAIRTAKNHLISILSAAHVDFPLYLWCLLLQQAEITLNLLRTSRIHPHLSAHHSLCGAFDFRKTPLAPPGIKVIAFNNVSTRESWAVHGKLGCYIGPAMNHYRCYQVYLPTSKRIITTDTLQYTEDNSFDIPYSSKEDDLLDAVTGLQSLIIDDPAQLKDNTSPRAQAISKLRQLLLPQATAQPSPLPRVAVTVKPSPLPRVTESLSPPSITLPSSSPQPTTPAKPKSATINRSKKLPQHNHYHDLRSKRGAATQPNDATQHSGRYNLRNNPKQPRRLLALCKSFTQPVC